MSQITSYLLRNHYLEYKIKNILSIFLIFQASTAALTRPMSMHGEAKQVQLKSIIFSAGRPSIRSIAFKHFSMMKTEEVSGRAIEDEGDVDCCL